MRFVRSAAALCFCVASLGWTQGLGVINGAVADTSGAVIPGAKVTVQETATGFSRTVVTSPEGFYVVPSLRPSVYDITVEAPSFRTFKQAGVQVQADQRATVNVTLEVGATTETVSVEANAVQVDTTTGTIKQVVDQQRIIELPLNGRNAASLTLLVPGAVSAPSGGADQGQTKTFPGAVTVSANGARGNQISYELDGGNNVDEYTNVNAPFPFPDALQEFSVQTSNYSAEYGQNAGGVVNIVTKSGTNDLHGDLFDFTRNAVFNARNFFSPERDQLKRSQFGAVIGGPVRIPGVYNGKDKTFFFFGYQGTRIHNLGGASNEFVPTPANLAGDFSALLSANNPANPLKKAVQVVDPATGQPFPGNMIPVSRFDPASLALAQHIPQAGGNGLVYFLRPIVQDFNEEVAKIDHMFSGSDRLSGRYYAAGFMNQGIYHPQNLLDVTSGSSILSQNVLLSETHIFSPSLLNDLRLNYARENSIRGPVAGQINLHDLGVNNIYQPPENAIPSIGVSGFFSMGQDPNARFTRNNYTLADDLRWVRGRHSFAFGVHAELSRVDIDNHFLQPGSFSFTSDVTNYAIASFLLGKMRSFRQGAGEFKNNRNQFIGVYAEDTFHVSKRLTLDYGLRYEPYFPWREVRGRVEQFRPDAYWAGIHSQVFVNAPPGLLFPGDPGVPENGTRPALRNFAPRVGFAYDVFGNGKTSLRGGAGIFYDTRQSGSFNNRFVDVTPFSPQLTVTDPQGPFSNPLLGLPNPFPAPFPPPKDAPFPLPVLAITYAPDGNYSVPTVYNYNLAIEQQLAPNWLARIAYVGSHSSHLSEMIELNPAVYIPGSKLGTDQRRIFQNFQTISFASQSGDSTYNSLQVSLEKRFSSGVTLSANYTWSKSTDDVPYDWNALGPSDGDSFVYPWYYPNADLMDRGPSDFDHTHRFVASFVWQTPALAHWNRFARGVLGDWQLSGVFQAQSGGPLTILAGKDQSFTGLGRDRAVLTGTPYGTGACRNTAPCVDYLNPNAFALPAVGDFGNVGKGLLRGPGLLNLDAGLFKNIHITERFWFQFRAEFFNTLNRVNLNSPTISVASGGFGSIRSAQDPRIGQLALKFFF